MLVCRAGPKAASRSEDALGRELCEGTLRTALWFPSRDDDAKRARDERTT